MTKATVLLIILSVTYICDAFNILVVCPFPGKSHNILGHELVRNLLNAGHEITYITPTSDMTHPNLETIDVTSNWDLIDDDIYSIDHFLKGDMDLSNHLSILDFLQMLTTKTISHRDVQELLSDHSIKFDVVIAEWIYNELYSGFAAIYNVPMIWVSTMETSGIMLSLVDEHLNTAYNAFFLDTIPPFGIRERAYELWLTIKFELYRQTVNSVSQLWTYNEIIVPHIKARGKVPPSFEELKYNASLVLGNSHVSTGQSIRLPQIYKPIGGYHIPDKVQPLPEDVKAIMDDAKDGVIYFSLGSHIKSKTLPKEVLSDLLEVFKSLKQTVLWKFEEKLPNVPKNVHFFEWAPQQSILAHSNCVLFITHGGLLSTTETIHYGVPIIGIPFFVDQFTNVNRAVKKGYAKRVDLSYTMGKDLKETINDMLTDPKYTEKVKELSFIYHNRPVKPSVELVHWVEHVINTGGAPHLRSPALHVSWYQKAYLDLVLVIAALVYVLHKLSKLVFSLKRYGVKQKAN